ncbi:sodium/calcium exchanger NCL-like [Salvia hispanica]|uniref:sodium/calcium exchanger NCL-like n=1 Tax=Salvia hispanica TaxID=49212 RepID=UPI002008EF6E|nr:sodium/calcium exchanger NCL-like [Salvia hispanica]
MASVPKCLILLILLASIAEGRILELSTSENELISDGIEKQESVGSCSHQYGFLPCAENAAGYIFLIVVYQVLLVVGGRLISSGSEMLLHITGAGKFGGIIFRILMVLPSMMLMILSGIFSSKEGAQSQVAVGVSIYAGITVFSLTIQWGVCMIYGKIDLKTTQNSSSSKILKDTGVKIDKRTSYTAGIMLLSLIPYVVLQLVFVIDSLSGERVVTLIAFVIASLSLLSYSAYQIWDPWMQERSLKYSEFDIVRTGFLQHVKRLGQLVNPDGKLNADLIKGLFDATDNDADKVVAVKELRRLVSSIFSDEKTITEKNDAVNKVMDFFDKNDDDQITEAEFIKGFELWAMEADKSTSSSDFFPKNMGTQVLNLFREKRENRGQTMDRIMSKILKHAEGQLLRSESLITENGKPNINRIKELFKEFDTDGNKSISEAELKQLIIRVKFQSYKLNEDDVLRETFREFDQNHNDSIDEPEFVNGMTKYLDKAIRAAHTSQIDGTKIIQDFDREVWKGAEYGKRDFFRSVFQVLLGIGMLTFLGKPLTNNILQLSNVMGFPSFVISFVVVPLAMNARSAVAAILPASKKSEETASWTFSEIYGGVIMNNMVGLTTLLAIVYAKELRWDFTAEALVILVVCGTMGCLAFFRTTYQLWTCILAFLLYPFSLGLFYFVQISYSLN